MIHNPSDEQNYGGPFCVCVKRNTVFSFQLSLVCFNILLKVPTKKGKKRGGGVCKNTAKPLKLLSIHW